MIALPPSAPQRRSVWGRASRWLPVTVDLAIVGGVAFSVLVDLAFYSDDGDVLGLWIIPIGLVSVAVAVVRRWAAAPGIVALGVGYIGLWGLVQALQQPVDGYYTGIPPIAPVAAIVGLSSTAIRRASVPAAIGSAAVGALPLLAVATWPGDRIGLLVLTILLGAGWVAAVGAGVYLRHLDDDRVRAADDARRAERVDLARELHDLVAHYVTGIVVQAQAAQVVADQNPAAVSDSLQKIEGAGRDALTAMRAMVGSLRSSGEPGAHPADGDVPLAPPVALDDLGGLESIAARSRDNGLPVTLRIAPDAGRMARGAVAASAHRIVIESLTNVHRHAVEPTGATVEVSLAESSGGRGTPSLVVTVTDDGRTAPLADDTRSSAGFGLIGMAERANALHGVLVAGPLPPPSQGWQVRATLPLDGH